MKVLSIVFFALCFTTLTVNAQSPPLPVDYCFEKGFLIRGPKHDDPVRVVDAQGNPAPKGKPVWTVAPWHSKGSLDRRELKGDTVRIYDDFKSLSVNRKTGVFNMTVHGIREYADRPGAETFNPWVHLLLSQGDTLKTPMLHTLESLVVELEFELTEFRSAVKNPPDTQAAQFQLFLYLRGVDTENPNRYKNFTWFGISVFDNRKDFTDDYAARDFAMQNGQFIYTIGSKHTLRDKVEVGKRRRIKIDILPHVKKALEIGHARGFMEGTRYEDTLFDGMNIGWEIPGLFDAGMTVHRFSITAKSRAF